ncbi:MAG: dihydrodipicolinate synthase family protein [Phycisphaerae bacterium]|nr:dihydrodipicolinate synthase family protein [Phycisphaerae bacterium]NIP52345.1 dihydrodipicolinate synthase family protein [Phycisphaerae bacterium]NIS51336.1 dihydrodipicolinate synthase family protein [Phycisphaerae bacterium]NIU08948.1 dihydrodipicolinate synthase family protein [Phycisphaerae bacterium]NIU56617.1 dihydrodipicolinate synthase family protein [Phycisphaerae bacterium]
MVNSDIINRLLSGCVIPAHPLALRVDNDIDEQHQKALTRYYLACGAGGLAVGVHTTQFAIHNPKIGLYQPVLKLAGETAGEFIESTNCDEPIMIAGIVGETGQAVKEAELAREIGYHLGLLSLTALRGRSLNELIDHARQVAEVIPIMGFYLQEAISQMTLGVEFWRKFVEIKNVLAIKIAPFNRYQTLDVLEAVAYSDRANEIALYTGNDDNIIVDLLTQHEFNVNGRTVSLQIVGGLLGQWACWTKRAVEYLTDIKKIRETKIPVSQEMLMLASQLTLANKAIFDADNNFAGCIPGILYVLKRQGLVEEVRTLDEDERLSPGQTETIDIIIENYPHLCDDDFVTENLKVWL